MDADATTETECLPACGSSFFCAAVADVATHSVTMAVATTAACGSSCFSAAAADSATTDAADHMSVNSGSLAGKAGAYKKCPPFFISRETYDP